MLARDIQDMYSKLHEINNKKLPTKLMFIISRDIKKAAEVVRDIDNSKNDLIDKYAERDKDGEIVGSKDGGTMISAKNIKKFYEELDQVLDVDIEISFEKVKMADIERCEEDCYDNLTVDEISALDYIIDEESEPEAS